MSSSNIKPEQVEVGQAQINPNRHIENYLNYYKGLVAPKFAVLITGEWGVGKTHLITKLLPCKGENDEAVYVSLYGLKTTEDIVGTVYEAMYPTQASTTTVLSKAGEALKGLSILGVPVGALGAAGSAAVSARLRKAIDPKKLIIFDDLERSSIDPKSVLGVINQYVEHEKCRCVVLSHDEIIQTQISDTKEKVFGQSLRVKPEVDDALTSFIKEIKENAIRKHIESHFDLLKSIFLKSGVPSLRILRQVVFDIARLLGILKPEHLENLKGVRDIVQSCAAFDLEVRFGYINLEQMKDLPNEKKDALTKKYDNPIAWNMTIPVDILVDMFFNGHYDQEKICAVIDNSSIFKPQILLNPWEIIIRFDIIEDVDVKSAVKTLEKQFQNREITDIGELLHVFALQSLLVEKGVLAIGFDTLFSSAKEYIDDIFKLGKLKFDGDFKRAFFISEFGSAYGFGFWFSKNYKTQFRELAKYLEEKAKIAHEASYVPADILEVLKADPQKFCNQIHFSREGTGELAELPVLKKIEPRDFVKAWLELPKSNHTWHMIKRALEERYRWKSSTGELSSETPWIKAVISELQKRANEVTGLRKFRIERVVPSVDFPDENNP